MHESNRLQANQLRIAAANNCVAPNATPQSYKGARSQGTAPRRARSPPRETGNPQEGRETTTSYHNAWGVLLANPLSLGQPQAWEYPVSLFNGGMANGTLKHGLEMDLTQSQLTQSHLHLPQLDWSSNKEPPLLYSNQATMPVSIIFHPKLA